MKVCVIKGIPGELSNLLSVTEDQMNILATGNTSITKAIVKLEDTVCQTVNRLQSQFGAQPELRRIRQEARRMSRIFDISKSEMIPLLDISRVSTQYRGELSKCIETFNGRM